MEQFIFSKHALEQMAHRGITKEMAEQVLNKPDKKQQTEGELVMQGMIEKDGKQYLLRIFVNDTQQPKLIKTVYLTSKVDKYK